MRLCWQNLFLICCLLDGNLTSFAQTEEDPSLEQMEEQSELLENATPAPEPEAPIPPAEVVSSPSVDSPSSSVESPINIKDKIKKVIDPNLFSGSVPAIYQRKSLNIVGKRVDLNPGEAPDEYIVQDGDTLYDICDQLLDDYDYWPKLWSLNPEAGMGIVNPHYIYPGMRLRFRTEGVPKLVIEQASDSIPIGDTGPTQALVSESLDSIPNLDDMTQPSRVVGPDEVEPVAGIADMFVDGGGKSRPGQISLLSPGFIGDAENSFEPIAVVVGGSSGTLLNTKKAEVILKQEQTIEMDKVYSVFRKKGKVYNSSEGDYVGYRFEFIAHVKVTSKEAEGEIFRGQVLLDRTGVQPGDIVLPFQTAKRVVSSVKGTVSKGASQEVVGFEEHGMQIGGRGSFVYFAQNPETPLEKGRTYEVIQNIKEISPIFLRNSLPNTFKVVGRIYVLDSLPQSALAYIVSDKSEIRLGDRISP